MLLRELIANLVDNAITYGAVGGMVMVRIRHGAQTILEVIDDGPGIPLAERERVFERFQRGSAAVRGGSGLGLSIVRDICRSHRAEVTLSDGPQAAGLCVRVAFEPPAPQG